MVLFSSDDSVNAPWDHAEGDLVLRSTDGDEFIVHKHFLVQAFQGFEGMFMCVSTSDHERNSFF